MKLKMVAKIVTKLWC